VSEDRKNEKQIFQGTKAQNILEHPQSLPPKQSSFALGRLSFSCSEGTEDQIKYATTPQNAFLEMDSLQLLQHQ
jgi:hypothetical protein